MEEKRNENLENISPEDNETSVEQVKANAEAPTEETLTEVPQTAETAKPASDTVTFFGKTIPKKPLIIASAVAAAVVILTVTLSLVFAKHPIAKFFEKMEKENNYQITITMYDIPFLGTLTMQEKVDGNVTYTPAVLFGEESYTERVGDDVYTYTKDSNDKWVKEKEESSGATDSTANNFAEDFADLLNPKNYKKESKNKYVQKDDVKFDAYDNVVITIDDDCLTIEMDVISEGMTFRTKIVISDIGDVELTLPKVDL